MSAPETWIIEQWLYATLSGDGAITAAIGNRIYADVAPLDAAYPFIVYNMKSASDVAGVGALRILTQADYTVKVITQGSSYAPIKDLALRIDTLLHRQSGTTTDGAVISATRQEPVRYTETDNQSGVQYKHLGGIYRLQAQSN
jgi:hypothetical protein